MMMMISNEMHQENGNDSDRERSTSTFIDDSTTVTLLSDPGQRLSEFKGSGKVEKILLRKTKSLQDVKSNKFATIKIKEERQLLYFTICVIAILHPETLIIILISAFIIKNHQLISGIFMKPKGENSSSNETPVAAKRRRSSMASLRRSMMIQKRSVIAESKDIFKEFIRQELTNTKPHASSYNDEHLLMLTPESDPNQVIAAQTDNTALLFQQNGYQSLSPNNENGNGDMNNNNRFVGPPIIIDLGSGVVKAGFASDTNPKAIFPTIVGKLKYKHQGLKDYYVGIRAERNRFFLSFKYPLERGIVQSWDDLDKIWHHAFYNELRVDTSEHPVLLTEPPLNPKLNREIMIRRLFDNYQIQAVFICVPAVLTLFMSGGRTSGVILDCGDGVSHVIAFHEGYIIPHAMARIDIAGRDATDYLMRLLIGEKKYGALFGDADRSIFKSLKEDLGYVAVDFEAEMNRSPSEIEITHTLPDGNLITIGTERFRCAEVFFDPSVIDSEAASIPVVIHQMIMKCNIPIRRQLLSNIVISGGSTMFEGFAARLAKEMKKLSPRSDVKIIEPKKRKHSAWSGGALIVKNPEFKRLWVTKEEFTTYGPSILHTRCGLGTLAANGMDEKTLQDLVAEENDDLESLGGDITDSIVFLQGSAMKSTPQRRKSEFRADSVHTDVYESQSNIGSDGTLLKRPVVIDTGSYICKVGFSDDTGPRGLFLTMALHTTSELLGREKQEGTNGDLVLVGEEAVLPIVDAFDRQDDELGMKIFSGVKFPIDRGLVRDFDDLERVWHCAFHNYMRVNPADHPVVLSEAPFNPKSNREKTVDIMLNKFGVPQVYICARELLSLYAADSVTGVVYQCGHTVSHVVPVYDGYVISHAMFRIDIAGRDIEDFWIKSLKDRYPNVEVTRNRESIRELKERFGFIAADIEREMAKIDSFEYRDFQLDDGSPISVREESFLCQEILFDPVKVGRDASYAAHKAIFNSIIKCDMYIRKELFGNIVICGGSSLFENLEERLTKEITKLAPQNTKVKVTIPNDRKYSAFMGGCIVGSLSTLVSLSVTKEEYQEAEKKKQGGGALLVAQKLC